MRRTSIAVAVSAALLATTLALAASAVAAKSRATTIKLESTTSGMLLTNGSGHTLYMFTKDGRNKNRCGRISGCEAIWPPVTTKGKPVAGPGVKASLLGTITISRGRRQVTYAGHPLYTFSSDFSPRETTYIGNMEFGGTWYGVDANGGKVK